MFRGRYEHTIDAKGRTSLPARYREVLASMARPFATASEIAGSGVAGDGGPTSTAARPFASASEIGGSGVARDGGPTLAGSERRIMLTSGLDPCLVAYAIPEWNAFEEKLAKLPQFDRAVQKLRRIYVSGAVECDVDDNGRILIPPTLREHAGLVKDVIWAGSGKYAELWDKDAWKRAFETTEDERADIAGRLAELGL